MHILNTSAKTKASVADSCSKPAQTARHHACPAHIRLPCFKLPIFRHYNRPLLAQESLQCTESIICTTARSRRSQTRRMKIDATQVAQRAADPTDFRNAQSSTSRRASNSVGHNPASGIQRIVAKTMVQDPLESLPKVSITVRSCKINASVPNYREVAENPPCISQVPFVSSTTGKKHGLSKIVCVCVAHTWQQAASRQNIVRSALFFFFLLQTAVSVRRPRAGWSGTASFCQSRNPARLELPSPLF